jgi:AcrR family transcriptional regulator
MRPGAVNPPARTPGRPASASADDVLDAAIAVFRSGDRVEVNAIATRLGLSRASIYRWFGSRNGLLGSALAREIDRIVQRADQVCRSRGAQRVLDVLNTTSTWLAEDGSLRQYFDNESTAALRMVTRSDGMVHPAAVATVAELIRRAEDEDGYRPPLDRPTLAYAVVRLWEAFLYNDAAAGFRGDVPRLRAVQAALLQIRA